MGIYYVDTSVFIDREGLHKICRNNGNTYIIVGLVLGELFSQILRCLIIPSDLFNIYSSISIELRKDCQFESPAHINDVINCLIRNPNIKLKLEFDTEIIREFTNHLFEILKRDNRLEVSDAMILAIALADKEADGFITIEKKLVNSKGILFLKRVMA
ncbi:hypothetical protein [Vulcanisaeta sp.]|uniref:hypothetical protein n=1 Tax=Vulcanisaeta sp. TaxID=2020871 RepID=UPI003D099E58